MTVTPDLAAVVAALSTRVNDLDARVAKLESQPPTPPPVDEVGDFLKKWSPLANDEFQGRYGVAPGQPIPAMTGPDVDEAVFRARAGYNWQGASVITHGDWQERQRAVGVIAHATNETVRDRENHPDDVFYTAGGLIDPNFAAYLILTGMVKTKPEQAADFKPGSSLTPYVGGDIGTWLANAMQAGGWKPA